VLAAKQATTTIPIVMGVIGDPLGIGIVTNLAHPGGNVTGCSLSSAELEAKRLQLLKEVVPGLSRVAILFNPTNHYMPLALQSARKALANTEAFRQSRRERKKVEMLFAHMKRVLKLDRLRLRGLSGAKDEVLLTAIAQNLRRLAKLLCRAPPPQAAACLA
jgi:hypothetical protein